MLPLDELPDAFHEELYRKCEARWNEEGGRNGKEIFKEIKLKKGIKERCSRCSSGFRKAEGMALICYPRRKKGRGQKKKGGKRGRGEDRDMERLSPVRGHRGNRPQDIGGGSHTKCV